MLTVFMIGITETVQCVKHSLMWLTALEHGRVGPPGSEPFTLTLGGGISWFVLIIHQAQPSPPYCTYLSCLLLRAPASTFSWNEGARCVAVLQGRSTLGIHCMTLTLHSCLGQRTPSPSRQVTAKPFPPGPLALPWRAQKEWPYGRGTTGQVWTGLPGGHSLVLLAMPANSEEFSWQGSTLQKQIVLPLGNSPGRHPSQK